MILFPAIDLKDGACVRLLRGDMSRATVYGDDPPAQARSFAAAGAGWIHVVDLDGAFSGRAVNRDAVAGIVAAVDVPVQLGGGIRDIAAIETWLAAGVARVVLGTAAARDPGLVIDAAKRFPGRVAVGIDARGGRVAVSGWAETSTLTVVALARRYADSGVAALIYTDIGRDGTLEGPDVAGTRALAEATRLPVVASGGVSGLDDLLHLRDAIPALSGAIVGRALYDGRIDLATALARLAERSPC